MRKRIKNKSFILTVVMFLVLIGLGSVILIRYWSAEKKETVQQIPIKQGFDFQYDDWTFCVESLEWYDGTSIRNRIEDFQSVTNTSGKEYAPEQVKIVLVQMMVFSNRPGEEYDGSRIFDLQDISFVIGNQNRSFSLELFSRMDLNWFYSKMGTRLALKEDSGQTVVLPVLVVESDFETDVWKNLEKEEFRIRMKGYPVEFVLPAVDLPSQNLNPFEDSSSQNDVSLKDSTELDYIICVRDWQEPFDISDTGVVCQMKSVKITRKTEDRDRDRIFVSNDVIYDEKGNLPEDGRRVFVWITMEVNNSTDQKVEVQVDLPIITSTPTEILSYGPSPVYLKWNKENAGLDGTYDIRLAPQESQIYEIGYCLDTDWVFGQFAIGGKLGYKAGYRDKMESVIHLWNLETVWMDFVDREGSPPLLWKER